MRTLAVGLCLGLWTAAALAAAPSASTSEADRNWAAWRGPLANGVAPLGNPPTEWSETKNIRWKVKLPGDSTATPIVWGDQIFLVSAIKTDREGTPEPAPDQPGPAPAPDTAKKARYNIAATKHVYQFVVLCVDRKNGQTLWQHVAKETVPHEGHHPDGSYASASPTTDGRQLYVSFGSRGVYCYDLAGRPKWNRDLGRMTIMYRFGEGSSPVVYENSVLVNWDHEGGSFLISLDADTGETRWKVDRDETTTWATPLVVEHEGRTQVVIHGSKRVRSYDFKTGELLWECGGQGPSAIPCLVTDGQRVYAMTGFIINSLYAIPLDASGDITRDKDKIAWKRNQGTPYVPSPLLYGNLLYFTAGNKGILSCLDAATGQPLIERQRLEGIENVYASPVGAADRIYITSREGTTVVIQRGALDAPEGTEPGKAKPVILATNKLDDRIDASAAIVGGEIFLRGREYLYCIGAE